MYKRQDSAKKNTDMLPFAHEEKMKNECMITLVAVVKVTDLNGYSYLLRKYLKVYFRDVYVHKSKSDPPFISN